MTLAPKEPRSDDAIAFIQLVFIHRMQNELWSATTRPTMPLRLLPILLLFLASDWSSAARLLGQLPSAPPSLHTSQAIYREMRLISIDERDKWTFRGVSRSTDDARQRSAVTLSGDQVVRWGGWPGLIDQQAVLLGDGSILCGELRFLDSKQVVVANDWLEIPPLQIEDLRAIVLTPPASLNEWIELQSRIWGVTGEDDVLWFNDGQRIAGVVSWPNTLAQGQLEDLSIESGAGETQIDSEKVQAIVFSPSLFSPIASLPQGRTLGLADGTLLRLKSVDTDAPKLGLELRAAIRVTSIDRKTDFLSSIAYLASRPERTIFLSDLTPASYRYVSDTKLQWELGVDRDLFERPLILRSQIVHRGLAMHSSSQAAYRWDGSPGHFLAEAVLARPAPQATELPGSVDGRVLVARNGQLDTVQRFTLRRGPPGRNEPTVVVKVNVKDVKLIVLIVEEGQFGQYGDQLLWLDARFGKVR